MIDLRYNKEAELRILREEAKAEGRAEAKAEVAKKMKERNFPFSLIAKVTGLTESVIADLEPKECHYPIVGD